ncbi:hypothetical protein FQN54_006095 [Arachnomyces sp. PD_36]|nr:hypothetical protein FQN54_006095 [Arachnomyces sp. PD_36]
MAEECLPLSGSKSCPSFAEASISRNQDLIDAYPFLEYVTDVDTFDKELDTYVNRGYVQKKYQDILGCDGIQLSNTSSLYARYTKSVLCHGIVSNSKGPCGLGDDTAALCADTCGQNAISEQEIASNPDVCASPNEGYMDEIRSDYTVCGLLDQSLTDDCVSGEDNESTNCGYGPNLMGLCGYCGSSSPNSTDTCCQNEDVSSQCDGVSVPTTTSTLPPLFPSSSPDKEDDGLTGGQIAGIVVGSILGFLLIVGLIALFFIMRRRRTQQQQSQILNQQSPPQQSRGMTAMPSRSSNKQGYEVLPGGRVARMSALQGPSNPSSPRGESSRTAAFVGAGKFHDSSASDSEGYGSSPPGLSRRGPPVASRRNGSLSSGSALAGDPDTSPRSGGQFSSPMQSGQSEQLDFFKDYYSQDDIHPNDKVSVLWAYQPRAGDEFDLDRGDMLKVVGIWDDGWATGVRINERAEDYDNKHNVQRDSGVSNGSERRGSSPQPSGEIKAFPLVCVCLPEHWRKTIEGDIDMNDAGSPV